MRRWGFALLLVAGCSVPPPAASTIALKEGPPHPAAVWPWTGPVNDAIAPGMTRWSYTAQDGTYVELYDLDLNQKLSLGLYDLDQDDEKPFDNSAAHNEKDIGWVVQHLDSQGKKVLLAWNGPFFAYTPDRTRSTHIGPVVIDGKLRYNVGNHRWTFGIDEGRFQTLHQPKKSDIADFDLAVSGLQCLIKDGKALRLEPFPQAQFKKGPVPSTPEEAGHIPLVDHMRTSRTSLAWSKDSKKLYILIVEEQDHELESKLALKRGEEQKTGWTLADIQRFWLAVGVDGAVNSDGGAVTQRAVRVEDGTYDLIPSRMEASNPKRATLRPGNPAIGGGTLMSFYIAQD